MSRVTPEEQFEILSRSQKTNEILIRGRKLPPPAKRVVLAQNNLRIVSAKITRLGKNNSVEELEVVRINHLRGRNEVRIHTAETLFPGEYEVNITVR